MIVMEAGAGVDGCILQTGHKRQRKRKRKRSDIVPFLNIPYVAMPPSVCLSVSLSVEASRAEASMIRSDAMSTNARDPPYPILSNPTDPLHWSRLAHLPTPATPFARSDMAHGGRKAIFRSEPSVTPPRLSLALILFSGLAYLR